MKVIDAIGARPPLDRRKRRLLGRLGRDNQLANVPVRYTFRLAVVVQRALAGHAQACLQRTGRIVNAGVNDLGVAAARVYADTLLAVKNGHVETREREPPADGKTNDAGAGDDTVDSCAHYFTSELSE